MNGVSVDYLYDGSRVVAEMTSAGLWRRGEVYAGRRHVATYADDTTYFNHADYVGTERARTGMSGAVTQTCSSLPFGDLFTCTGTDSSPNHFTGQEHDWESGLDYFGARYYASSVGRFITPDWSGMPAALPYASLGAPQTLNRYAYGLNNPASIIDSDGHRAGYANGASNLLAYPTSGELPESTMAHVSVEYPASYSIDYSQNSQENPQTGSNSGYNVTSADMDAGTNPSNDPLWPSAAGKAQAEANPQYLQITAVTADGIDLELRGPGDTVNIRGLEQHETRYSRNGGKPTSFQAGRRFEDRITGRIGGSGDGTNSIQTFSVIRANGERQPVLVRDIEGKLFYSLGAWIRSTPYAVRLNGNLLLPGRSMSLTPPKPK